ncbi:hypothetical protein RYX36_032819 [Vicia faba]
MDVSLFSVTFFDKRYGNAMFNDKLETRVRKQWKLYDVKEHSRNKKVLHVNNMVSRDNQLPSKQHSKPVVEDLYKIPPELLRTTKREKSSLLYFCNSRSGVDVCFL